MNIKNKGQILPIVIVILIGFMLLIYAISSFLQHESTWTVKEKRTTEAFHLAEAGIDRAQWKLNETSTGWSDAVTAGTIPSMYKGTTEFLVEGQGYYKVLVSTTRNEQNTEDWVVIQCVSSDLRKEQVRGLKAIYSQSSAGSSAISSINGVVFGNNAVVHWGGVYNSKGNVEMTDKFPRKYAGKGYYVKGRDPDNGPGGTDIGDTNGAAGVAINTPLDDEYKDWSSNNVREVPEVNIILSGYMTLAKAYGTPAACTTKADADPEGSGYYPGSTYELDIGYDDYCSSAVYYCEGNVNQGKCFIGPLLGTTQSKVAIICLGTYTGPQGSGSVGPAVYTVNVPTCAWKEYQAIDTTASDQYPGDTGLRSYANTVDVNAWDSGQVVFNGLLYVSGNFESGTANKKYVGVTIVKGKLDHQGGTLDFFYNKDVDTNVLYSSQRFGRQYWAEFNPYDYNNPQWSPLTKIN